MNSCQIVMNVRRSELLQLEVLCRNPVMCAIIVTFNSHGCVPQVVIADAHSLNAGLFLLKRFLRDCVNKPD